MNDTAFAYQNSRNQRKLSSSGGAFPGIVDAVYELAGKDGQVVVYGAAFGPDLSVVHKAAYSREECVQFCGSKYVQSRMDNVCGEIAGHLSSGKYVLFSGTPCQAAAVSSYVEKLEISGERLFLVDIACHGTPGQAVWRDYVVWLEKRRNSTLVDYTFRYKPEGWKGYPACAGFADGTRRINTHEITRWQELFRKNLLLRKTCFQCRFPGNYRSDMTIADFWGVEHCMPDIPTSGGVSLILPHTARGRIVAAQMGRDCTGPGMVFRRVKGEDYLKYNQNLVRSTEKPKKYDAFWADYERQGMDYVLHRYGGDHLPGKAKFYIMRGMRRMGVHGAVRKILSSARIKGQRI